MAPPTPAAAERLIGYADGDARRLLNALESAVNLAQGAAIDEALLERALGEQLRRYDKGGEQFYDVISALHKSIRGSDLMRRSTGWSACWMAAWTRATSRAA